MSKILRTLGLEKLSIFENQCVKPLFASLKQLNVFALDIRIAHVDTPTLSEYPPGAHRECLAMDSSYIASKTRTCLIA